MHRLFLGPSLTKEVVVTQHFAMIGSENGQAVFETTGILDEVTDLVVYEIDHAVISSVRTAHVVSVKANLPGIEVKTLLEPSNSGTQSADGGIGQVPVGIAIVVSHRWHERWVGINKGNVEEKREGRTNTGERVASGTYFYTLLGGGMYFHVAIYTPTRGNRCGHQVSHKSSIQPFYSAPAESVQIRDPILFFLISASNSHDL